MSKEQPPVREVVPFKQGKRPSTFRRLNVDFAGTALEQALAERDRQNEKDEQKSIVDTTIHQSPPVTTSHQQERIDEGKIVKKQGELTLVEPAHIKRELKSQDEGQKVEDYPPVTTTPQYELPAQVAPTRDFNRRANSIERDAMPSGLFPGSTKKVYDALYLRTRGAITPCKTVQASRRDLLEWTGIRNLKTIDNHIRYLLAKGLVIRHWERGSIEGSKYEVVLPEEALGNHYPPLTTTGGDSPPLTTTQKMTSGYTQKMGSGGEGELIENKDTYRFPNTFNTHDDDDTHTFVEFNRVIMNAVQAVMGVRVIDSEQERERWREVGEVIAEELKNAAQYAGGVSSAPAFLAAHLRRRFARKERSLSRNTAKAATDLIESKPPPAKSAGKRVTTSDAKSKFKLEECRRYAEHLQRTGQGITNPGGYATTIHRSGEADEQIEEFLSPRESQMPPTELDASECPDCKGSGWWYPKGTEKGIAKCKHEKLAKTSA